GSGGAAAGSIERMRPCAIELRRITACRRFSRARSSTNWPRPRSRRKSSRRSIALPMKALRIASCCSSALILRRARKRPSRRMGAAPCFETAASSPPQHEAGRASCLSSGSYHDRRLFVEQRPRDPERRQGGGLVVHARRLALRLHGGTSVY